MEFEFWNLVDSSDLSDGHRASTERFEWMKPALPSRQSQVCLSDFWGTCMFIWRTWFHAADRSLVVSGFARALTSRLCLAELTQTEVQSPQDTLTCADRSSMFSRPAGRHCCRSKRQRKSGVKLPVCGWLLGGGQWSIFTGARKGLDVENCGFFFCVWCGQFPVSLVCSIYFPGHQFIEGTWS